MSDWQQIMDFKWRWRKICETERLVNKVIVEIKPADGCKDPFKAVLLGQLLFEKLLEKAAELFPILEARDFNK